MNEFIVYKIPGVRVTINYTEFKPYPLIEDDFISDLHDYKEFNLPIQQPTPKTEEDVKQFVHDTDVLPLSLTTYQMFVRNFMSNYTPYNGMLLFHGLGSGKTCSSITICEEYRNYLKTSGKQQRIYVLSMTDAIVKNFKYQLFNESHLQQVNNRWVCTSCVGDKFLQELDPYQVLPMKKENIVKLIQALIDEYYVFMGCRAFANEVGHALQRKSESGKIKYINENYEGALFVIDEAHNIKDDTSESISFATSITQIVTYTTIKLLLMTATPVFHSCRDFIFLSQLLNRNDKRPFIQDASDIFDSNDMFTEGGKEVFIQHLHGYVSYVKGENPYSFPYRIYPDVHYTHPDNRDYTLEHIHIYPVKLSEFQSQKYMQEQLNTSTSGLELTVFNIYNQLAFITYPNGTNIKEAMTINEQGKLPDISYLPKSERFFDPEQISKYSGKLHQIQTMLQKSSGIILIYVRQITEGIYPIAVALEAIGYKYKDKSKRINLCKDYSQPDNGFSYAVLNPSFANASVNIQDTISTINQVENKDGNQIKVVIITDATTEGIDFKNIRQIHILNPWWNLSQIEQIIGRAVRFRSHKDLDFKFRNVEIFMHTAMLHDNSEPTIDYKMYCNSEQKAKKIGEVTRVLKEIALDCRFNSIQTQTNKSLNGLTVYQVTSTGLKIEHPIGDMPYTVLTDYMKDCNYTCNSDSYSPGTKLTVDYLTSHKNALIQQIKVLFNKNYVYTREEIIDELTIIPQEKIDYILSEMIDNKIPVFDRFNRQGYIVNIGEYYMFQPPSLEPTIPTYERRIPMAYVHESILIEPIQKEKQQLNVQKLLTVLKTKYDIAEKENTQKMRAVEDEYLIYSVFEDLYKKLDTLLPMKAEEWAKDKQTMYIHALMDRLTDVQCFELGKYLHEQPSLNEFEHQLKNYYEQFEVNGIYILWEYTDVRIAYYKDWKKHVDYKYPSLPVFKQDSEKNIDNKELPLGGISVSKDLSEREFKLSLPTLPSEKPRFGFKITKKPDAIDILHELIPTSMKEEKVPKIEHLIWQIEFCLRYFDLKKHGRKGKRWFLNPVEVIQNVARNFNLINENLKEKEKKKK